MLAAANDTGAGSAWPWVVAGALVLVAVGAYAGWRRLRATSASADAARPHAVAPPDAPPEAADVDPPTMADLRSAAAAALVGTDDAIRSSQQELSVVRAEAGDDVVEPFTAALDLARDELDQAFATLRAAQECAETDQERPLLEQSITRCAAASAHLDDLAPRFDALRDLEARVDEVLAHLAGALNAAEDRLAGATTTADALRSRFPRATIASVLDDLEQATDRLRFAQSSVAIGHQLRESSDRAGAAAHARAAEEALVQAGILLDSVERSPGVLAKAQDAVTTLLTQTEQDIAEAERLGVADNLAGRGRYARETLGWAGEEVSSGGYDPLEMRRALQDTDIALGRALGPIRPDDETHERAVGLLASSWYGARAAVRAADELIMTRRGAVGVEARARLSEARRHYRDGMALGESDPTTALGRLRTADALAYQARTLAQQDEATWRNLRRMAAGMDAQDGMILGGILIESPTGGGVQAPGGAPHRSALGPPSFGGAATGARRVGRARFEG